MALFDQGTHLVDTAETGDPVILAATVRRETDPEWAAALDLAVCVLLRCTLAYFNGAVEARRKS